MTSIIISRRSIAVFLLIFCANNIFAQKFDALLLKKQLKTATTDSLRCRLNHELGRAYEFINADSCNYFFEKSLAFATQSNNQGAIALNMLHIGYTYIYYIKNETLALKWLNKAIAVAKKINDNAIISQCYQRFGIIATHQNIGNAYEFYLTALNYAKKSDNWKVLLDNYEIIVTYLVQNKRYEEAENYVWSALEVSKINDLDSWFSSGLEYCELLVKQKKYAKAQKFAKYLSTFINKLKKDKGYFVFMNDVSRLEIILKDYDMAEKRLQKILKYEIDKPKIDTFHLYFIYQNLDKLYVNKQDYQKAYLANNTLTEIEVWLAKKRQSQDTKLQMTQLKANFDLEKKEVEIKLLVSQKKLQLIWLIIAIVAATMLIGFLVVLQRNKKQIENQKTELSKLNNTKDKLFAILSHDLRSPVASLRNYMMLTNWGVLNQNEFAESAKSLNKQLSDVNITLENVLDWSISQMGGMQPVFKKVDLYLLIEEKIQNHKLIAEQKRISIRNNILPDTFIMIDINHLMIILRNLLQNAIKFTNENGNIRFDCIQDEAFTTIKIVDNGVGMLPDQQKSLFKLSPQTSSKGTAQEKGTGLGLFLVKELVEVNNGIIKVFSEINQGTTFEISFIRA